MANVVNEIANRPKPMDIASWWKQQPPDTMTLPLEDEEKAYLDVFTSDAVDPVLRIGRGIADPGNLTQEDKQRAKKHFGDAADAIIDFVNYENRRRIIAHYTLTHPATIAYELQLYRLSRDVNPLTFVLERVHELFTGKEAFTNDDASRIKAAIELLIPVVVSRVLRLVGPAAGAAERTAPLTDPIWDLPAEGGGMRINGRWYTEHALERMSPDTPEIRAELRTRAVNRLGKIGIQPGSEAYNQCLARALEKIDPRGVPPSVVEAEISSPGTTNVRVITARRGQVVVTVIPKKKP